MTCICIKDQDGPILRNNCSIQYFTKGKKYNYFLHDMNGYLSDEFIVLSKNYTGDNGKYPIGFSKQGFEEYFIDIQVNRQKQIDLIFH